MFFTTRAKVTLPGAYRKQEIWGSFIPQGPRSSHACYVHGTVPGPLGETKEPKACPLQGQLVSLLGAIQEQYRVASESPRNKGPPCVWRAFHKSWNTMLKVTHTKNHFLNCFLVFCWELSSTCLREMCSHGHKLVRSRHAATSAALLMAAHPSVT